jgi:hypothetical protein
MPQKMVYFSYSNLALTTQLRETLPRNIGGGFYITFKVLNLPCLFSGEKKSFSGLKDTFAFAPS